MNTLNTLDEEARASLDPDDLVVYEAVARAMDRVNELALDGEQFFSIPPTGSTEELYTGMAKLIAFAAAQDDLIEALRAALTHIERLMDAAQEEVAA